jgi:general secretion pathway protein L
MSSAVQLLNDLFAVQIHGESGDFSPVHKTNVRELQRGDRLVLLLAPQDVSVIRIKRPPLSHADMAQATPALLKDALDMDPNTVSCLLSQRSSVENGSAYGFVSLCDEKWINYVKQSLLSLQCKDVDIFPFFELIPSASGKCNFVVDFDELDAIAWRCGEYVGGGSSQIKESGVDHINDFCCSIAKIHGYGPEDVNILSTKLQNEFLQENWIGVTIQSLVESAVKGNEFDESLNFMGAKRISARSVSWQRFVPSRFLLVLILFVLIESFLAIFQRYQLQSQTELLTSAMFAAITGRDGEDAVSMGEEISLLPRAIRSIRYAKGENSDDDFNALLRVFTDSRSGIAPHQLRQISYKNSELFITADPKATFSLDPVKFPLYTVTKMRDGLWKISGSTP